MVWTFYENFEDLLWHTNDIRVDHKLYQSQNRDMEQSGNLFDKTLLKYLFQITRHIRQHPLGQVTVIHSHQEQPANHRHATHQHQAPDQLNDLRDSKVGRTPAIEEIVRRPYPIRDGEVREPGVET